MDSPPRKRCSIPTRICSALCWSALRTLRRRYLRAQIAAGAAAVQLFDTWVGELTLEQYREFALPATQLLIEEIGAGDTPVILYTKASSHLLSAAAESGANVLSVDWRVDLATVREQVGIHSRAAGQRGPVCPPRPGRGRAPGGLRSRRENGRHRPHSESWPRNPATDAGGKCARVRERGAKRSGHGGCYARSGRAR